ncbi:MAG TPA: AMP-binding protein [Steroidobacter sp.]|jgi:acetoacetyl-CoA synthetase|nr:AMP-binding protein [Steroidobacteraceae bacterium]HLS82947.1 AMP-binding protein [Steroidobacter sp.]
MEPIWSPSSERIERAQLTRFMQFVRERHRAPVPDYLALHRWSVEYPEKFWSAVWDFCDVRAQRRATQVIADGHRMPGARWFVGARLNYAQNLLRRCDDAPAVIAHDCGGSRREFTWARLHAETARVAAGLRSAGVTAGERVVGWLPNTPEAVVAMLATTSVGAVWCCFPPQLGERAALERLRSIKPRVLFVSDRIACPAPRLLAESGAARLVIVSSLTPRTSADAVEYEAFGRPGFHLEFAQLPFDAPAFIACPGEGGDARCLIHSAGGALLQHLKDHVLHADLGVGDRYLHHTSCGEVAWCSLTGALAAGATIVLWDAPDPPDGRELWRICAQERVNVLGVSCALLDACARSGLRPRGEFDLSALRTLICSGAPVGADIHKYVYSDVNDDVLLEYAAGGPHVMGSFATGCPIQAVYEREVQCLSLGMKAEALDEHGRPTIDRPGELVCSEPFPSLPLGLWGDADGEHFRAAYFHRRPDAWRSGAVATITRRGSVLMHAPVAKR